MTSTRQRAGAGQATVEFVALVLLACLTLTALLALSGGFDGRSAGGFLVHHFACAVSGRCDRDERNLVEAYGTRDAAAVRALAPGLVYERGERQLPVDWRECRQAACATAPDDPALDAHVPGGRGGGRLVSGRRATVFTHLIRRRGRLYVQYWLYYPDSNTELVGSRKLWRQSWWLPRLRRLFGGTPTYPGFHRDDWEGAFVRVDPDGTTWIRASSHGHVQGCKWRACHDRWVRSTKWVRVSRGSHSGHVPYATVPTWIGPPTARYPRFIPRKGPPRRVPLHPGPRLRERSTTAEGLRLVPLETLDLNGYRPQDPDVTPPWRKGAYRDPESGTS
jgi:hypothetical protein